MRRLPSLMVVGFALAAIAPGSARAQAPAAAIGVMDPYRMNGYYAAPGLYGMSFGSPSFGVPRTYSSFSSPYGAGYGYGYAPYGLLPGRYGVGLWRPGFVTPGYAYGASYYGYGATYYRTFALPGAGLPSPPVGVYAPGFGPGSFYSW